MNKKGGESRDIKIIIDTNKHGIRREYPAAGYKAVKKLNKKNKEKVSRGTNDWYISITIFKRVS